MVPGGHGSWGREPRREGEGYRDGGKGVVEMRSAGSVDGVCESAGTAKGVRWGRGG